MDKSLDETTKLLIRDLIDERIGICADSDIPISQAMAIALEQIRVDVNQKGYRYALVYLHTQHGVNLDTTTAIMASYFKGEEING